MDSNKRKKMIMQGFDTVAAGYSNPSLSFFPETAKRLVSEELLREQFNVVGITNVTIHHEPQGYLMTDAQMWWDVVWNAGWRGLSSQFTKEEQVEFKREHMKAITKLLGEEGVWFGTGVLIGVGER